MMSSVFKLTFIIAIILCVATGAVLRSRRTVGRPPDFELINRPEVDSQSADGRPPEFGFINRPEGDSGLRISRDAEHRYSNAQHEPIPFHPSNDLSFGPVYTRESRVVKKDRP